MKVWTDKYGDKYSGTDHHPAIVSSESVDGQVRGDPYSSDTPEELLHKPTKIPKPNKNENHEQVRGDPCCSDTPEWLQEFREHLVDDRVPEHRDSHASSLHELSLELMRRIWVDTVFILTSPKSEFARSPEDQNHKSPVQKTDWQSRTSCRNFWRLDYSRSQSSSQ